MKNFASAVGVAVSLVACAPTSDPWVAQQTTAAAAVPGQATPIAVLAAPAPECEPGPAPRVEILQDGAFGVLSVESGERLIDETGAICEGVLQPVTTVLYQPHGAGPAIDSVAFVEIGPRAPVDRRHTVQIRVR